MVLLTFDSPTCEMCFPQLFGKATESAERQRGKKKKAVVNSQRETGNLKVGEISRNKEVRFLAPSPLILR